MMNRTVAYYGGLDSNKENLRYKKTYSSIMPIEIVHDSNDNSSKFITYVGGDAYSAPIVHIKKTGASPVDEYHYLHRDYLGSILAITDSNANIVEQTHFGAWGKVEQFSGPNGATTFNYESSLLGRGYTGHEHFVSVGLIHMNGRMYDANLGRFLSPDNFVQDPYSTQSFNRFGYVWNNPLKYTDPSGEELFTILVGALIGAWLGGTVANGGELNPFAWKWDGDTWKGVIIGGIIGAIVGASVHSLITGNPAFGIFTVKASIELLGVGSIAIVGGNSAFGGIDFQWSTAAGGGGTVENAIKYTEKEVKATVETGDLEMITTKDYENAYIDAILSGADGNDLTFTSVANRSLAAGRLYMGARITQSRLIKNSGKFKYSNGRLFSNRYSGGRWHSGASVQLAKTRFNSSIRFAGRLSKGLAGVSLLATTYDGLTNENGWQNSHTADVGLTLLLTGLAVSNPLGWVVGGVYLVADLTTQYYTGRTITQNLFDN